MRLLQSFLLAVLAMSLLSCQTEESSDTTVPKPLRGHVVDQKGEPVSAADLAFWWKGFDELPSPEGGVKSKQDGSFEETLDWYGVPQTLFVMDASRTSGGCLQLEDSATGKDLRLELTSLKTVTFTVGFSPFAPENRLATVFVSSVSPKAFLGYASKQELFSLRLPPGIYDLEIGCKGYVSRKKRVTVDAQVAVQAAGAITLPMTILSQHVGKPPPPWSIQDASGISKDIILSQLKGKWVLLDFWTWWCGPCTRVSVPELMVLQEKHKAVADKFLILSIHCTQDVKTCDEVYLKLKNDAGDPFKGKKLPFPLLVDSTGATLEAFGISAFPTVLLIDPAGNLVRQGYGDAEAMLEDVLNKLK